MEWKRRGSTKNEAKERGESAGATALVTGVLHEFVESGRFVDLVDVVGSDQHTETDMNLIARVPCLVNEVALSASSLHKFVEDRVINVSEFERHGCGHLQFTSVCMCS